MKKTASQVLNDLYPVVKASALASAVKGSVYKSGMRPLNALTEDVVINVLSGTALQIQDGVVNINTFVPDIDNGSGNIVWNTKRCREIETIAGEWIDSIEDFDGYRLTLDEMIRTMPYEDNKQHFVNIRLKFDYTTF